MVTSSSPSLCGWQLVVMQNFHGGRLFRCFGFYFTAMERYYLNHFLVRCHSVLLLLFVCSSCATHSHSYSHGGHKDGSRRIMSPSIHENVGGRCLEDVSRCMPAIELSRGTGACGGCHSVWSVPRLSLNDGPIAQRCALDCTAVKYTRNKLLCMIWWLMRWFGNWCGAPSVWTGAERETGTPASSG